MAENEVKTEETAAEQPAQEQASVQSAPKVYSHILVLGIGGATRNVQIDTNSKECPKPIREFIGAFRTGKKELTWTPTANNPVFAVRIDSVSFYEYRMITRN